MLVDIDSFSFVIGVNNFKSHWRFISSLFHFQLSNFHELALNRLRVGETFVNL